MDTIDHLSTLYSALADHGVFYKAHQRLIGRRAFLRRFTRAKMVSFFDRLGSCTRSPVSCFSACVSRVSVGAVVASSARARGAWLARCGWRVTACAQAARRWCHRAYVVWPLKLARAREPERARSARAVFRDGCRGSQFSFCGGDALQQALQP